MLKSCPEYLLAPTEDLINWPLLPEAKLANGLQNCKARCFFQHGITEAAMCSLFPALCFLGNLESKKIIYIILYFLDHKAH